MIVTKLRNCDLLSEGVANNVAGDYYTHDIYTYDI